MLHTDYFIFNTEWFFFNSLQSLTYDTPAVEKGISTSTVFLIVANETLACSTVTYYPDPEFINFTSTRTGKVVRIDIQVMRVSLAHMYKCRT